MANNKPKMRGMSGTAVVIMSVVVFLLVYSLCLFLIPFEKKDTASFGVAYAFLVISYIIGAIVMVRTLFANPDKEQRILGLPIVKKTSALFGASFFLTTLFVIINANAPLPVWVVIVIYIIGLGLYFLFVFKGSYIIHRNAEFKAEMKQTTSWMEGFRARLIALNKTNTDQSIAYALEDLMDSARGSDPVSNEQTKDIEEGLGQDLERLKALIRGGQSEEAAALIAAMKDNLVERNQLCKIGK